jgi:hypothetical protein
MMSGPSTPLTLVHTLADEFFQIAGSCLAQWAIAEEKLFLICLRVLKCSPEHAAIVYYRIPSTSARLTMIGELVLSILPKSPKKTPKSNKNLDTAAWLDLNKKFSDLLEIRNIIAHKPVTPIFHSIPAPNPAHIGISGFELYYSKHEQLTPKAKTTNKQPLQINDLKKHLIDVSALGGELHQFLHDVLPRHT